MNKKITIIIPAKGTSKRLPNKNMLKLGDDIDGRLESLVYIACEKALNVPSITNVYIDTESDKILNDVSPLLNSGLQIINRPKSLATNNASGNDLIVFEQSKIEKSDLILHTYATSPLITSTTIEECIQTFLQCWDDYDSFFSAIQLQDYIWNNDGPINFTLEDLPNSQDLPKLWTETHGIYGIKDTALTKYKRRLGRNVLPIEINRQEALDINNYEDFKLAEILWNN